MYVISRNINFLSSTNKTKNLKTNLYSSLCDILYGFTTNCEQLIVQ